MKIGLATCHPLPEPDLDEELTRRAFLERGHECEMVAWNLDRPAAGAYDAIILRSTWNYYERPQEFRGWLRSLHDTTLLNPLDIVLWNLDKRYLADLSDRGIPTVPTVWIRAADARILERKVSTKFVVKPTIGAGSFDTRVFELEEFENAMGWLDKQPPDREFLVQPYFESVTGVGESSIVMIGSQVSHRVVKHPRFMGQDEHVSEALTVPDELASIAKSAIAPFAERLLYARVDCMQDDRGEWRLSELELIEPSLFFLQNPSALTPFVERFEALVQGTSLE